MYNYTYKFIYVYKIYFYKIIYIIDLETRNKHSPTKLFDTFMYMSTKIFSIQMSLLLQQIKYSHYIVMLIICVYYSYY